MGIENFYTFAISTLLFIMTPGIDTVFVLNKSISEGKKSGVYATLGVNSGIMIHTLIGALGLSILIANSPIALATIKYCGAVYLIYSGISTLLKRKNNTVASLDNKPLASKPNSYFAGLITNTLNPKVALLFLAFFPQFISPTQIENPLPFVILGLSYAVMGTLWYLLLTFFASQCAEKLKATQKTPLYLNTASGIVFILMGLLVAY